MTAVSFLMYRGVDGFTPNDVTVAANAPASEDFEFRFNVLDGNGKNINDFDIIRAMKAMIRWLEIRGGLVGIYQITGITQQPSGPPN